MSENNYKSTTFSGNAWRAPSGSSKNGLCLSGGGSRALSAGLGQLIGLKSLANNDGGTLLDSVDYISSVSGGTWLTSIFTFSECQNLEKLLGTYIPADQLNEINIAKLPSESIGHVPSRLSYRGMLDIVENKIGWENIISYPETRKWIWPVIIGELVLKPYELYEGSMQGNRQGLTPMPTHFFTYNKDYIDNHIKNQKGGDVSNSLLEYTDFYYCHDCHRPFPIMNTNIKLDYQQSNSALLPVQGTPIAVGATGTASQSDISFSADGAVQSFGFTSTFESIAIDGVTINIKRRYSLSDLVACSSAFFAEMMGGDVANAAAAFTLAKHDADPSNNKVNVTDIKKDILKDLSSFVPQYNFWPVGEGAPENKSIGFADGGNLDNTGLLGMLARSDAENIVVCYNSESPLGKKEKYSVAGVKGKKIALVSTDIPILFGYQPTPVNGKYILFSEDTPAKLNYLKAAQVFKSTEFAPLVSALFANCNGEVSPTTAYTASLSVCDNAFAGIENRGSVNVLWLYNNYCKNWVNKVHESSKALAERIKIERKVPFADFHHFPNYNTASQICLNTTQVNALAQYQAWVINQVGKKIKEMYC